MSSKTLVIGGASGIGYEISKFLVKKNYKTFILSRRNSKNKNHIQFDINDINHHQLKIGKIKNIIFCQRSRINDPILDYKTMIVNPVKFIKSQLKNFLPKSSIIFIGSSAQKFVYKEQNAFYHASRGSIYSLTKYLSYELGKKDIRVNCIIPSTLIKKENSSFYKVYKNRKNLEKLIPNKTMVNSKNIAQLCLFLCSNNSIGINGEIINVDNGLFSISQETIMKDLSS